MSASSGGAKGGDSPLRLPANPSLEHLKKQAKRRAKTEPGLSLQQAQHRLALDYGCPNWAALCRLVGTMNSGADAASTSCRTLEELPAAANRNDLAAVERILKNDPFTQRDLDQALARAVLCFSERRAIAELLVRHGADPDGQYGGNYGPIVFVTGECLDPEGLQFLIDQGADVAFEPVVTKYGGASPLSSTLGTYLRGQNARKHQCIEILLQHGAVIPREITPAMLAIHRGDAAALAALLDRELSMAGQRFPEMPYGNMELKGATLTHLAVESGEIECLDLLLDRGADINAPAAVMEGIGGQTPVFHAIAANHRANIPVLEHLAQRWRGKIDMSVRATFRCYGESQSKPMTPLEYGRRALGEDIPVWRRADEREITLLMQLAATSAA